MLHISLLVIDPVAHVQLVWVWPVARQFSCSNFIGEPKERPRNMQTIEKFEHEVQLI